MSRDARETLEGAGIFLVLLAALCTLLAAVIIGSWTIVQLVF